MDKPIRIGTRDSELAMWQAQAVQSGFENLGHKTEIIAVKSQGDLNLDVPLYEMGITGIFTKTLDIALLKEHIDIAVHSMKDVPTMLPKGVVQAAILPRAEHRDILVYKKDMDVEDDCTIATGSLRRKAQWLNRYPHHQVVNLRGNVQTRMQKLKNSDWDGAIFAYAGLDRVNMLEEIEQDQRLDYTLLENHLPAPAQGAVMVATLEKHQDVLQKCQHLNHLPTAIATRLERQFLRTLEGGCTAPIGSFAAIEKNKFTFNGCLYSLDGNTVFQKEFQADFDELNQAILDDWSVKVTSLAEEILATGGREHIDSLDREQK